MHAFFCAHRLGWVGAHGGSMLESARQVEPGCRGGRPGLPLTIGSLGLSLYLLYIYILFLYTTPGCIQYRECTKAQPTRPGAHGPSQPIHTTELTQRNRRLPPPLLCLFTFPRSTAPFPLSRPSAYGSISSLPRRPSPRRSRSALAPVPVFVHPARSRTLTRQKRYQSSST